MKPSEIPRERKVFIRASSDEWSNPDNNQAFAEIQNSKQFFHAKICLKKFGSFDKDEINVNVYKYDIQVRAVKEDPLNPNRPIRTLSRQYRLPCDIDLSTISLKRNHEEVDVNANKIADRCLPIGLSIVDVTAPGKQIKRVQAF